MLHCIIDLVKLLFERSKNAVRAHSLQKQSKRSSNPFLHIPFTHFGKLGIL